MNKTIAGGEKIQKKIESQDNSKTEDPLREKKVANYGKKI